MNATLPLAAALERALTAALDARSDLWWVRETTDPAEVAHPRCLCLPVADRAAVGLAVGLAWSGARVVVDVAATGRLPALVEVLAEAARPRAGLPCRLVLRVPLGGELGALEGPWVDLLAGVHGLRVVCPRDAAQGEALLAAALEADGPVVLLEPRAVERGVAGSSAALGDAVTLRAGADVVLLGWGAALEAAVPVCEALAREGVDAGLVDLVSLAPLDGRALAEAVSATGRAAVVRLSAAQEPGSDAVAARVVAEATRAAFWSLEAPVVALEVGARPPEAVAARLLDVLDLLESP